MNKISYKIKGNNTHGKTTTKQRLIADEAGQWPSPTFLGKTFSEIIKKKGAKPISLIIRKFDMV